GETRVPGQSGPRIERTRVMVTGDVAFVTNRFLDHLSNARFLLNGVNWLTEEEQLLATTSHPSADRPLPFTPERQARVLAGTVGTGARRRARAARTAGRGARARPPGGTGVVRPRPPAGSPRVHGRLQADRRRARRRVRLRSSLPLRRPRGRPLRLPRARRRPA